MSNDSARLYEAIKRRHSRRVFTGETIADQSIRQLEAVAQELQREIDGCRSVVIPQHDGSVFSGLRGGYGVIRGAPSYIAFVVDTRAQNAYAKLGYTGETLVLEATSLGLGTCWVSGTFDSSAVARDLSLRQSERVFAVTPIGHSQEKHAVSEKIMSGFAGSHRRKTFDEIIIGPEWNTWPQWALSAVEAARIAPSAMNRQPWLFRLDGKTLSVEVAGKGRGTIPAGYYTDPGKRLDCGIALCHLAIGAEYALGQSVSIEFADPPQVGMVEL